MKRRGDLLYALFVVVALGLLGASCFYRIVRTPWQTVVLKKPRPYFGGSYIDTRPWKARDFTEDWALAKELMERDLHHLPAHEGGSPAPPN